MERQGPVSHVRCFPPDDDDFCAAVGAAVATIRAHEGHEVAGDDLLERLGEALRPAWPKVRVVPLDPLAATGFSDPIGYAYRDGRLTHERMREPVEA